MKVKKTNMNKLKKLFIFIFIFSILLKGGISMADEKKDTIHMTLKDGVVVIETKPNVAPKHVKQIKQLIEEGQYDGAVSYTHLTLPTIYSV